MQTPVTFIVAFIIVLALIGLVTWLVRRFAGNRLGGNAARGRVPRLAVIDAAAVDGRRRLVLVRRDNVEHLLMIGGPSDIVVEPNIVRAVAPREPAAPRPALDGLPPRPAPFPESDEIALDHEEAAPAAPDFQPRPPRPAYPQDARRAPPVAPERRTADPLAGFAPEPRSRPEPRIDSRAEPRAEPRAEARLEPRLEPRAGLREPPPMRPIPREPASPRTPPRAAEPLHSPAAEPDARPGAPAPTAEENLAEMAQRLEAALRRPGGSPPAPEPPAAPAPTPAAGAPAPAVAPVPSKGAFENLEEEMASLLGRPKSPS
jgi:hypothetical protein